MEKKTSTPASARLPWILVLALLLLSAWLLYERFSLKSQNDELQTELSESSTEKSNVKRELADLLVEYENMKTNNDTLNVKLQAEQQKIEQLLEEIQKVKSSNAAQIARYKREVKTLREIMRSFVRQIDSLNTLNQALTAQVEQTETKYRDAVKQKEQLATRSDSLSTQVALASTLKADGIVVQTLNERGNVTNRASKTTKIEVCFVLRDNTVASKGTKNIHLRIADPSGTILTNREMGFFVSAQGKELAYSATRATDYDGKKTEQCIYFTPENELGPGNYEITLFEAGKEIGVSSFKIR